MFCEKLDICFALTLYNAKLRIARNFLETKENIKISTHPFYHINLGWISWEWSNFFFFFFEKKFKMADSKKAHFSKSPILKIFSRKFFRFVLGLVGLNDAKGIDVAQRIWPWGCPTKAQKQPKSTENAFFGCFWAFVGQPHGHIHWATSMPFASFNPTNPRTNLRNFREKILRIGDFEKRPFFESAILNFFFSKKKFFFLLHSYENQPKFTW